MRGSQWHRPCTLISSEPKALSALSENYHGSADRLCNKIHLIASRFDILAVYAAEIYDALFGLAHKSRNSCIVTSSKSLVDFRF